MSYTSHDIICTCQQGKHNQEVTGHGPRDQRSSRHQTKGNEQFSTAKRSICPKFTFPCLSRTYASSLCPAPHIKTLFINSSIIPLLHLPHTQTFSNTLYILISVLTTTLKLLPQSLPKAFVTVKV